MGPFLLGVKKVVQHTFVCGHWDLYTESANEPFQWKKAVVEGWSNLKTQIKIGGKKVQKFKPKVLVVNENEHFRWKGKLFFKGLFDGEHYFILEKIDDNRTKLIHGENFSGLFSKPILKMIKEDTLKGFEQMNQALKSKVESK